MFTNRKLVWYFVHTVNTYNRNILFRIACLLNLIYKHVVYNRKWSHSKFGFDNFTYKKLELHYRFPSFDVAQKSIRSPFLHKNYLTKLNLDLIALIIKTMKKIQNYVIVQRSIWLVSVKFKKHRVLVTIFANEYMGRWGKPYIFNTKQHTDIKLICTF